MCLTSIKLWQSNNSSHRASNWMINMLCDLAHSVSSSNFSLSLQYSLERGGGNQPLCLWAQLASRIYLVAFLCSELKLVQFILFNTNSNDWRIFLKQNSRIIDYNQSYLNLSIVKKFKCEEISSVLVTKLDKTISLLWM